MQNDGGQYLSPIPQVKQEKVDPMVKGASGLFIPKQVAEKAAQKYAEKAAAQKNALRMRPTRRERRALGNTRADCPQCKTPVKLKNFSSHMLRLHPSSLQVKQDAPPVAHEHFNG